MPPMGGSESLLRVLLVEAVESPVSEWASSEEVFEERVRSIEGRGVGSSSGDKGLSGLMMSSGDVGPSAT